MKELLVLLLVGCIFAQSNTISGAERLSKGIQVLGTNTNGAATFLTCDDEFENVVYYTYTTESSDPITISTCFPETDFSTTLFTLVQNGVSCGPNSRLLTGCSNGGNNLLIFPESGDTITIGVSGEAVGNFKIMVQEVPIGESNSEHVLCSNPKTVLNGIPDHDFYFAEGGITPICEVYSFAGEIFYEYIPTYDFAKITITMCDLNIGFGIDFNIGLGLIEDCGACAQIVLMDEFACADIILSDMPAGVPVHFWVSPLLLNEEEYQALEDEYETDITNRGETEFGADFTVEVVENPLNDLCVDAFRVVKNGAGNSVVAGTTISATSQTSGCNGAGSSSSQIVYYSYTTGSESAEVLLEMIGCTTDYDFEVHIFTDCSLSECVQVFSDCPAEIVLASNTQYVIGVTSAGFDEGNFNLQFRETPLLTCNPEGPEYECETSYTLVTDHFCGDKQCVTVPSLYLGFCFDNTGCECDITRVPNTPYVDVGVELTHGDYEVLSIATNDDGISSDLCSFGINVEDECNPNGPKLEVPKNPIYVPLRSSCSIGGVECGTMPPFYMGACEDYPTCGGCTIAQTDQLVPGTKLLEGQYEVTVVATNANGFSSSPQTIAVIVE